MTRRLFLLLFLLLGCLSGASRTNVEKKGPLSGVAQVLSHVLSKALPHPTYHPDLHPGDTFFQIEYPGRNLQQSALSWTAASGCLWMNPHPDSWMLAEIAGRLYVCNTVLQKSPLYIRDVPNLFHSYSVPSLGKTGLISAFTRLGQDTASVCVGRYVTSEGDSVAYRIRFCIAPLERLVRLAPRFGTHGEELLAEDVRILVPSTGQILDVLGHKVDSLPPDELKQYAWQHCIRRCGVGVKPPQNYALVTHLVWADCMTIHVTSVSAAGISYTVSQNAWKLIACICEVFKY